MEYINRHGLVPKIFNHIFGCIGNTYIFIEHISLRLRQRHHGLPRAKRNKWSLLALFSNEWYSSIFIKLSHDI